MTFIMNFLFKLPIYLKALEKRLDTYIHSITGFIHVYKVNMKSSKIFPSTSNHLCIIL